ncbi:hypothetical protein [Streptomyces antarcticus]|uniref:hypothetical protein n=1 Tax=Streptomyces antarcticus TaxID=2996458 RepID=UPI002270B991|nr:MULTISPECIES: hypothetical protein [unclassified Streptomyces]MCY0943189.1 hypothetical protein [Streptomyces sp. H34-AA3]MCY0953293.1 hypothetical protein [Streptomyces sp. H27-S2]MCZ4085259.1 hypothetical protein [Streptomyces sp. H34-S5]
MSESVPSSEQPERVPEPTPGPVPGSAPETGSRSRKRLGGLVPRHRGARWAAAAAAVVIVGGGIAVVAVAAADRHPDRHRSGAFEFRARGEGGEGGRRGGAGAGEFRAREFRAGERLVRTEPGAPGPREGSADAGPRPVSPKGAPAPLPSLGIGEAAQKAAGAVSGGKVESLRVVGQKGGGSAWSAVVLGPDGVRHAVTVSGTDGTVTGNTVVPGR